MRMRLKSVYSRFVSLCRNWLFSHFDAIYLCRWFVLLSGASSMFPQLFTIWIDIIIPLYAHVGQCWNNDTQHWFSIRRSLMICVLIVFRSFIILFFLVSGRPQKRRKKKWRTNFVYLFRRTSPVASRFFSFPFQLTYNTAAAAVRFLFSSLSSSFCYCVRQMRCEWTIILSQHIWWTHFKN